jgi:alpha-beta hydrolase superfamily lysophospholipase
VRWENEVPARTVLSLARFRPGREVEDVSAPALLLAAPDDPLVADGAVAAAAGRMPRATFLRFPAGEAVAPRALGHELAFLADAVGDAAGA